MHKVLGEGVAKDWETISGLAETYEKGLKGALGLLNAMGPVVTMLIGLVGGLGMAAWNYANAMMAANGMGGGQGFGMTNPARYIGQNPRGTQTWNQFQGQNKGKGWSPQKMSSQYRNAGGRGGPGVMPVGGGGGGNRWMGNRGGMSEKEAEQTMITYKAWADAEGVMPSAVLRQMSSNTELVAKLVDESLVHLATNSVLEDICLNTALGITPSASAQALYVIIVCSASFSDIPPLLPIHLLPPPPPPTGITPGPPLPPAFLY
jgi:hypothetical protein